ncbi:MAG: potassium/proton antiporter [Armatimonadetes bacterium]|nr:potassium/proton antiporter [Armatimonadota bacterium]
MNFDQILLGVGLLLGLCVLASKFASKLGVPVLVLFVGIGMLAGSDGIGGIWFEDARLAQQIGVVALVFILFAGGMDLDWKAAKPYVGRSLSLATVGVALTAGVVAIFATQFLGFGWAEGLLLGAIISSTDAAAVFSTLTQSGNALRQDVRQTIEIESGSNDPTAIFLTTAFVDALAKGQGFHAGLLGMFVWQMLLGALGGYLVGRGGVLLMRALRLDHEGLFHAVSIVIVLVSYGGVALLGGNGFLAVYIAGVVFGQGEFRQKRGLRRFHDGIAWLMQILMFLVLGLLVFPSQLPSVILPGLAVGAVLMFVARPVGTVVALLPFRMKAPELTLISWAGLRGAVPIILATIPLLAGIPRSQEIFNLVFFVVLLSALLQGTTIPWLSRKLGLIEEPVRQESVTA